MLEWTTSTIESLGYLGIALLMFLETIIIPIPSELVMPLAGFTAAQGKLTLIYVILAGTVGTVLGALPWYYVGKLLGEQRLKVLADRHGKWFGVSGHDIEKAKSWFDKHGGKAVFFCRLVPGVRTWVSVPAGISRMHLLPFLIYSVLGSTLWVSLLTYGGYTLGNNYQLVEQYSRPASKIVLIALSVAFIIWIVRRRPTSKPD